MMNQQIVFILTIWLICYLSEIITPIIDFRVGIRKAKERGEEITSDRWKDTPKKISNYLLFTFAVTVVDLVQMALVHYLSKFYGWSIPLLPFLTSVAAIGVCLIEVKSIYENNDVKTKREAREIAKMAAAIVKAHGDINELGEALDKYLNNEDSKDGND